MAERTKIMPMLPCKGCTHRIVELGNNCHDRCEEYLAYKQLCIDINSRAKTNVVFREYAIRRQERLRSLKSRKPGGKFGRRA